MINQEDMNHLIVSYGAMWNGYFKKANDTSISEMDTESATKYYIGLSESTKGAWDWIIETGVQTEWEVEALKMEFVEVNQVNVNAIDLMKKIFPLTITEIESFVVPQIKDDFMISDYFRDFLIGRIDEEEAHLELTKKRETN